MAFNTPFSFPLPLMPSPPGVIVQEVVQPLQIIQHSGPILHPLPFVPPPPMIHHPLPMMYHPQPIMYHTAPLFQHHIPHHQHYHQRHHSHPPQHHRALPVPAPAPTPAITRATFAHPRTVHIITYSTQQHAASPAVQAEIAAARPANVPKLLTVHAENWPLPPPELCQRCSGVSAAIQDFVKNNAEGSRCIDTAVNQTIGHLLNGQHTVLLEVCCGAGTHRSVAAAEIMAQRLRRKGVQNVVVRHLHRVRKPGDVR
ncbi:hypothetical protein CC80DRAFT_530411 [Byssothecium circinans]|uniref:RapZ C-terminal domain-containing protein n=1 Tax=Byssothecium circinans TaxID=147558 RepID=A0A6A5UEE1_9PLEO|nr:hypothetical protein CC80DRAFT_530411 [Byssothecium circinans]